MLFAYRPADQVVEVCATTERKTHVRARDGQKEPIADDIRFLRMGDERANCIRDRHCHLMDANVVIRAHADYYPLDRLPLFWAWLLSLAEAGRVAMPVEIFEEVCTSPDLLGQWLRRTEVRKAIVLTSRQIWPRFRR